MQYSVVAQKMEIPPLLLLTSLLQSWLGKVMRTSLNGKKVGRATQTQTLGGKRLVSACGRNRKVRVSVCHEQEAASHTEVGHGADTSSR